jgi:ABC-type multidrug transport system ATPase subunit
VKLVRPTSRQSVAVPLGPGRACVIGAAADTDLRLEDPGLLACHAQLGWRDGRLFVEAIGAAPVAINGRAVTGPTPVEAGDWLALGDRIFQVAIAGAGTARPPAVEAPRAADVAVVPSGRVVTIGRLADNDVQVESPIVSRRHARIVERAGSWAIEDLGSTNGTFVNGRRIENQTPLGGGEQVEIGTFAFVFRDGALRRLESSGSVRVDVRGLGRTVPDAATGRPKPLLANVNLAIQPGEFVGIFGTSGSGKSTLLDALNGRRPASSGSVLYNGTDLYRSFDLFRATIGYVPQQDIVHRRLTVHNALVYTARLRLPEDTSRAEIESYVKHVLALVNLADKGDQPIDTPAPLSGGQLKRVSLAVELVSNPGILFLDEVTSGLDAGTDKRMMRLFAELAAQQKTVVCVTHTLENIDACHLVVVLCGGRLAYFGPPEGVCEHFKIRRTADVYETLETASPETWAERYEASALHRQYVAGRLDARAPAADGAPAATVPPRPPARRFDWRQAGILIQRYVDLIFTDRRNLAILLAQAPIIGAVIGLVFKQGDTLAERIKTETYASFMLVVSAIWFGCLNAAREVVKERPVYLRERAVNLAIGPYLTSKVLPLAALCAIQCVTLLGVLSALLSMPGSFTARAAALFLSALAATALGLTVSALVNTNDKAVAMIPILLIPQIVLANAIVDLEGTVELVAKLSMISFWGFDCMKATLADDVRAAADHLGRKLVPVRGSYESDLLALGGFFCFFLVTAVVALRRQDRSR